MDNGREITREDVSGEDILSGDAAPSDGNGADAAEAEAAAADNPLPKRKRVPWLPVVSSLLAVTLVAACWLAYGRNVFAERVEELETTYSPVYLYLNSITVNRFEEMVASGEEFLVEISRPNCPYCREIEPHFVQMIQERGLGEKIYYLNVKRLREDESVWVPFKEKYGFWYTPAFMHYKDGKVVDYIDDDVDAEKLEAWLDRNL
ncbi:MAG: thioredoxin family protein [Clostridiales Family XIII bacterium]|jgi:predicted bacteriocin transport accessory protein|nr:thioredoxin family protein [Clostridiales Family XIII bacterium]